MAAAVGTGRAAEAPRGVGPHMRYRRPISRAYASPLLFALLLKLRHRHIARVRSPLCDLWLSFRPPDFLIDQTLNILKGCHLYDANRLTINVTERLRRRGLLKAPINIGRLKHSRCSRRPLQ